MSAFRILFAKLKKLKPLWQALSPRRRRQLLGLQVLSVLSAAGEVANLGALLPVLQLLSNPSEGLQQLGPISNILANLSEKNLLFILGLSFFAVVAISTTLRVVTIRSQLRLAALIAADLGEQVFSNVLQMPFAWHLENNSSKVIGFLTKDVDRIRGSIASILIFFVNAATVLLLAGSLVAIAPVVMITVSFLLALFYILVFQFTRKSLRADGQRLTDNYQSSLQIAQESLGGIRDVIIDRSQNFYLNTYRSFNLNYRLAFATINTKTQAPRYLIEGFAVSLIIGLALTLALRGQSIEQQLPLLGTLALGSYRILQPLQLCFNSIGSLQANQASLLRLNPFLKIGFKKTPTYLANQNLKINYNIQPLLQLRQLSFRYTSETPWVIKDLDFSIQEGERIAFVGPTGSGKSTVSDLIIGLLRPTKGSILLHGKDLYSSSDLVRMWQKHVSHVPQNIYLSDATFASNIAFGVPSEQIDQVRVVQAAEQARISEVINNTPEGYNTIVGERGVKLSGGQRQRIGLARALYKKAKLLVLDEATSALDNRTEAEVMEAINNLDKRITIIMIAHRLTTIQRCDRILLLDKGKIAGLGTYNQLITHNDSFQRLSTSS